MMTSKYLGCKATLDTGRYNVYSTRLGLKVINPFGFEGWEYLAAAAKGCFAMPSMWAQLDYFGMLILDTS